MGRNSCSVKPKLRKGLWSPEEDEKLCKYITRFGVGCWSSVPKLAGLQRCGKSCRLRWINYLRPDLKRGMFSQEEEDLIISLHQALGNRWAQIATQLPGRTDNEIKNFWNSSLKKKLIKQGIDPNTHKPITEIQVKDETDCINTQEYHHFNNTGELLQSSSTDNFWRYDPMFLSEFQQSDDFGFDSMPNLTNFDQQSYSDSTSASRISAYLMNEVRESSSNSSNVNSYPRIQTNREVIEHSGTFSWDIDNKVDTMFQFQFTGIQSDERKQLHDQVSDDFSEYALTSLSQELTDAFKQI